VLKIVFSNYNMKKNLLFILVGIILCSGAIAQSKILKGVVKDSHNDDVIPYASVQLLLAEKGKQADSAGEFVFYFNSEVDTLLVSSVGYAEKKYTLKRDVTDTLKVIIFLDRSKVKEGVVVKTKFNRGLALWKKIVKNKDQNNRLKYKSFSYDLYNKMELDIVNLNKEKIKNIKLLKPFAFILNNIDSTSEIKPFLPIFLTETFSKYYLQNNPRKSREIIVASHTSGIDNESVSKLLGGMYQNVNIYNNFIPVFNTDFVSPLSDNADGYYKYKVTDTQMIGGQRFFHLTFRAKREGDNTFEGDCWVHDSTFAIQKISMALDKSANINYVEKLSMSQDYHFLNDSVWFIAKEKFVVNVAPVGKNNLTITGRKTTNYNNIKIEDPTINDILKKNKTKEDIVLEKDALEKPTNFWQTERPEVLSKNEQSIYHLLDTLQSMPLFKKYSNTINFITTGTKWIGNVEIGPWYNWISGNSVEGTRLRFDLGTNTGFHKKMYLHGYLAYGTKDRELKGKMEMLYILKKEPRMWIYAGFTKDYDNGQVYYDEVSQDNIFSLAIRKPNVPNKFLFINEKRVEFFKEWSSGFSVQTGLIQKEFEPIRNLPSKNDFVTDKPAYKPLNNFESFIKIRFAYLERFLEGNYYRSSLGSPYPIAELKWNHGFQGILGSAYQYNKLNFSISDYFKTPPLGSIYYNIFAGKVFGKLPFMLLEVHPGNEIFYYNKYAFNMMNRFEYISDQYAGINVEHNVGNGLFKFIPITRKLKFRQFWNAKVLWGSLSEDNKAINLLSGTTFKTLEDQSYIELGTGVDNIFKFLRIDCVWRVTPRLPTDQKFQRFAVFGSFRVTF
jgi:hypothetical protein